MDKWNTQFLLVMLCSMRGTKIARVEGLWLVNRPNCSVSENLDDSPEVWVWSPFIVASQNSMRDHCDVISWCPNHLLWSSSWKTTAHAHRKHRSSSAHLLASIPESLITIDASEPLRLFLNPNSVPVTYIPNVMDYGDLRNFISWHQCCIDNRSGTRTQKHCKHNGNKIEQRTNKFLFFTS